MLQPCQDDRNRVKSKISDEEMLRRRPVQKSTNLRRSSLIEQPLQPDVGVYEIHRLIAAPFQGFFLKLQGGVLVAKLPQRSGPVLPQFPAVFPRSSLIEGLHEILYLFLQIRRQIFDPLFNAFHGITPLPDMSASYHLAMTKIHQTARRLQLRERALGRVRGDPQTRLESTQPELHNESSCLLKPKIFRSRHVAVGAGKTKREDVSETLY